MYPLYYNRIKYCLYKLVEKSLKIRNKDIKLNNNESMDNAEIGIEIKRILAENYKFYEDVILLDNMNPDTEYFTNRDFASMTTITTNERLCSQKLDPNNRYTLMNIPFNVKATLHETKSNIEGIICIDLSMESNFKKYIQKNKNISININQYDLLRKKEL